MQNITVEDVLFYSTILICISLGSYYKRILDIDMKRNYGAGLGLLVSCLICGHQVYHSAFIVWGNIIIIKCCDKRYLHQMSLVYTWTYLSYMYLSVKSSIYSSWMHQTIALRLVGLAFEIHLSSNPRPAKSSPSNRSTDKIVNIVEPVDTPTNPSAVDIISYSYFFIGLHRGPFYRFKIFEEHFKAPFGVLGDCRVITQHKLKKALICFAGYMILRFKFSPEAYYEEEFYQNFSSESRYLYSLPQLMMYFLEYQTNMMLCTAVCTETGFGVYPAKCLPKPGHGPTACNSLLKLAATATDVALRQEYNFSMLKCCDNQKVIFGPKMRDTIRGWDMSTRYWFTNYIYKHLLIKGNKEMRSACAFLAWCIWIGPSLPHLILCASLWVYVSLEAEYSDLYHPTGSLKFPWHLGFSIMRVFCLLYLSPCFTLNNTKAVLRYYNSVYWVYHIILLMMLLVLVIGYKIKNICTGRSRPVDTTQMDSGRSIAKDGKETEAVGRSVVIAEAEVKPETIFRSSVAK